MKNNYKLFVILVSIFLFFVLCGLILPKLVIEDSISLNEQEIKTAKSETRINYIDKPFIRLIVIEMKTYKNDLGNLSVDLYTFFGYKLGIIEFLPEGNSRAKWFF